MAKKLSTLPTFSDPGMLKPRNMDAAVRYNPPAVKGAAIPTFSESTRFGVPQSKDAAVRYNPKTP